MLNLDVIEAQKWQLKYKNQDYNPKLIFKNSRTKTNALFSLSFFLMIMASEILFNQPFRKKIGIVHNKLFKNLFKKKYERIERIETNSFCYSLFLILHKLFKEEETLKENTKELISFSICHWANSLRMSQQKYNEKRKIFSLMWNDYKDLVLSPRDDVIVDLIIDLYKSFEVGISNKKIIKKNIAVLIFSVSKVHKEFRFDVLNEFKKLIFEKKF
ncbi:MAG: hypothetical protein CMM95_00735 [Rickettsiales bacterium]|nr:hypothetical protein [Rickettsiales bacterium]|tara:strand:+ start:165 stop:809 length:645 start_codon:yes stop_codon:yes gene_type:complete